MLMVSAAVKVEFRQHQPENRHKAISKGQKGKNKLGMNEESVG